MKKLLPLILSLVATGLVASAQPAPKVLVIDLAKVYNGHYKTEEQNAKLRADELKAQEEVERLNKDGNQLVEQYKELNDQATNPVANADAKSKAQTEAQRKLEQIQNKKNEIATYVQNVRTGLQQRAQTFQGLLFEEIGKIAADIAKRKGATLLIDKSGPTGIGISSLIYSDPSYEITDEVINEINKTKPVSVAAPAVTAPAAAPAAPASDAPKIKVPAK